MGTAKYVGRVGPLAGGGGNRDCARRYPGRGVGRAGRFRHECRRLMGRLVSRRLVRHRRARRPPGPGRCRARRIAPSTASGSTEKVDRIADRPGHIDIGSTTRGVVAARDTVGRAGCGGEHRRRGTPAQRPVPRGPPAPPPRRLPEVSRTRRLRPAHPDSQARPAHAEASAAARHP